MSDESNRASEARLAAISGIIFSALSLAVLVLAPELAPPLGGTADEYANYFTKHRPGFLLGNYLGMAAFLPGLVQLVIVTNWIRRRATNEGWRADLVLATGIFAYAMGALVLVFFQIAPFLLRAVDRAALQAVASMANGSFCLFLLFAMPYLVAVAWATLATNLFPKWFAYVTFAGAVGATGASFGVLVTSPRWLVAGGEATGFGFIGFFVWTLILALLSFKPRPVS